MAFCINCGHEVPDGARGCANCGKAIGGGNTGTQRKTTYDGELHKCPNCGEIINSFDLKCKACGFELRGRSGANKIQELERKLEEIESQRGDSEVSGRKVFEQKINLVRNFAIPNTKEDILEFLILALSNIDMRAYGVDSDLLSKTEENLSLAWLAKAEQAFQKASLLFKKEPEFEEIKKMYNQKMKEIKGTKTKTILFFVLTIVGPLLLILGIVFAVNIFNK